MGKRRKIFPVIMFTVLASIPSSFAQYWSHTYGGEGDEVAYSVQKTRDGGFIVAGDTTSSGAGQSDALVMKLDETEVSHKSDQGFVKLNLSNQKELQTAYEAIQTQYQQLVSKPKTAKIVLMEQLEASIEVIVGAKQDATFGPVLMFGMGGVLAEVMDSTAMRICPVDKAMVMEMIDILPNGRPFDP